EWGPSVVNSQTFSRVRTTVSSVQVSSPPRSLATTFMTPWSSLATLTTSMVTSVTPSAGLNVVTEPGCSVIRKLNGSPTTVPSAADVVTLPTGMAMTYAWTGSSTVTEVSSTSGSNTTSA